MDPVIVERGDGPLVLGFPHTGTHVPEAVRARLNARGRQLTDTDWRIEDLYGGLAPGATVVRATVHRYVVDANRDPSGASLYPGQSTTDLVPLTDFEGEPIWTDPPTEAEVAERTAAFHAPYHAALRAEMERVRDRHGVAILWDAHSIRSRLPFLFDGLLPDLNIGTNSGASCDPGLERAVADLAADSGFTHVANGRFKGGWTTRHYGQPGAGWHAIQMEIAQSAYLVEEAPPWTCSDQKAQRLRPVLGAMLRTLADLAPSLRRP
ncbi:N-formylglutamate deformylase [Rubellimicrobium arenae]|uniref:N-formylglutamate deformylase n=1 Tax=Rubellimicrobium arenae TaxID=2817372 RepID=UPI001B309082|nr:N-formylglutamate deformylase [Rubellimicrobium arenae]